MLSLGQAPKVVTNQGSQGMPKQYAKEGVRVLDPMEFAFDPVGEELSASDFRSAAESSDINRFLPNGVEPQDVLDILGIQGKAEEANEHVALPIFFRMIEEALDEKIRATKDVQDGYKQQWQDTIDMVNKGANKEAGGGKGHEKGDPDLKSAPGGGGALEEGIIGETWYYASDEQLGEELKPMYLTLNKHLAEAMGEYVYSFEIIPESVWHMSDGGNNKFSFDIDTIGYSDASLSEASEAFDVFWDPTQFKEGFESIYVINPSVLEISSMAGVGGGAGSVKGYSLPLGAKPTKKKNKVYMEPHMHQDEAKIEEISTMSGAEPAIDAAFGPDYPTYKVDKKAEKNQYPYAGIKINIRKKKYRHNKEDIKFPRSRKEAHKYSEE